LLKIIEETAQDPKIAKVYLEENKVLNCLQGEISKIFKRYNANKSLKDEKQGEIDLTSETLRNKYRKFAALIKAAGKVMHEMKVKDMK